MGISYLLQQLFLQQLLFWWLRNKYCHAGGCWSFSTTGAIEGINKIVTGSLVSLSEQELVDCDRSYNSGCEGGLMDYAYQFVIKNQGIDSEADYPYVGMDKPCNKEKVTVSPLSACMSSQMYICLHIIFSSLLYLSIPPIFTFYIFIYHFYLFLYFLLGISFLLVLVFG